MTDGIISTILLTGNKAYFTGVPMAISQNIYFTFFSIGSFIPVIFHLLVTYYFFSIPGKSRSTFHLAMGYLFMMIFNLAYVLSSSILHPASAYHRWVTVGVILLAETHFTMFMLNFGGNNRPVLSRIFLTAQYCISVIITAVFCLVTWSAEKVYHFDGHYWDFAADKISAVIGLVIMGYLVVFIIITAYKTLTLHGRDRRIAFLMGLSYLVATVVPSFTNTMSRQGLIDRELFQITWALFNIFGFFSLAVIYINNSMEKTNFLARVMGISFVTLLTLLQGMSYLSMTDMEKAFNEIHGQRVMRMVSDSDYRPPDLEYITVQQKGFFIPGHHIQWGQFESHGSHSRAVRPAPASGNTPLPRYQWNKNHRFHPNRGT